MAGRLPIAGMAQRAGWAGAGFMGESPIFLCCRIRGEIRRERDGGEPVVLARCRRTLAD
jgi:hypothetical protein